MKIRYQANLKKILESLVWIAGKAPGKDIHFLLKVLFYADKFHLQRYGRPVTGDVYVKMTYGPVASAAYDMLKRSEYMPAEDIEKVDNALLVNRGTRTPQVHARRQSDMDYFSETDIECLEEALEKCLKTDFCSLTATTHQERAWIESEMNREMDYELLIDEDIENRDALLEYIRESAACLAL